MARDCDGTADGMRATSSPVSALPVTIAAWINPDTLPVGQTAAFGLSLSTNDANYYFVGSNSSNAFAKRAGDAGGSDSTNFGSLTTGVWSHLAVTFKSAVSNNTILWNNGSQTIASLVNTNHSGLDRTSIGCRDASSQQFFFNGKVAEYGVWNIELSTPDVLSLSNGVSPLFIRPDSLVAYWPLIGRYTPEINLVKQVRTMSAISTTPVASDHPRIFYPKRNNPAKLAAAAGGGGGGGSASGAFLAMFTGCS